MAKLLDVVSAEIYLGQTRRRGTTLRHRSLYTFATVWCKTTLITDRVRGAGVGTLSEPISYKNLWKC